MINDNIPERRISFITIGVAGTTTTRLLIFMNLNPSLQKENYLFERRDSQQHVQCQSQSICSGTSELISDVAAPQQSNPTLNVLFVYVYFY